MANERAHALIDEICGTPDAAAIRAVAVLHAQAAALAWVRQATGAYPAPASVSARLQKTADQLKDVADQRDPNSVLIEAAAIALAEQQRSSAA